VWCFFDESYHPENGGITAIAGCLVGEHSVKGLDIVLYQARRKHFGREHARDLTKELKGNALLSKGSFDRLAKFGDSRNHELTRQIFRDCITFRHKHPLWLFGSIVHGTLGVLTRLGADRLNSPFADMIDKVSACASVHSPRSRVNLVFDSQICGQEPKIAAAVRRFVCG